MPFAIKTHHPLLRRLLPASLMVFFSPCKASLEQVIFKARYLVMFMILCVLARGNAVFAATANPAPIPPLRAAQDWRPQQLAELQKTEIRLKHLATPTYEGKTYYMLQLSTLEHGVAKGRESEGSSICFKRLHLVTNLGEYKYPKPGEKALAAGQCLSFNTFDFPVDPNFTPEAIVIKSAHADYTPATDPVTDFFADRPKLSTGDANFLQRDVDVMDMLRSVPLPPIDLATAKGPLPKAGSVAAKSAKRLKGKDLSKIWPLELQVYIADISPDKYNPDFLCYLIYFVSFPQEGGREHELVITTNISKNYTFGAEIYDLWFGTDKPVQRIVFQKARLYGAEGNWDLSRNALPLLTLHSFKPLPFVTDKGPLPPSALGVYAD